MSLDLERDGARTNEGAIASVPRRQDGFKPGLESPQLWRMMALSPLSLHRGRQARKAPGCRFEIASAAVFPELLKFAVGSARRCGRVIMTACITFTSTTKVDDLVKVSCCGSGVRSRLVAGIGKPTVDDAPKVGR